MSCSQVFNLNHQTDISFVGFEQPSSNLMNKCENCTTLSCTLTTVYNLSILFTKRFAS